MAFTTQMPTKLLAGILGRMAMSLAAGVAVRKAWKGEVERVPRRWRGAMESVGLAIGRGESLSAAMAQADDAFPPLIRAMVAVGDRIPGLCLRRRRRGEGAVEPAPGQRREPVQRVGGHVLQSASPVQGSGHR